MYKVNHIIIVGGGSSAWLTAAYLASNNSCQLTMVDKEHGKPIGVGEATLLNFQPFMESCGFKVEEWFNEVDATYKTGILFPGWGKNGQSVWHPFVSGAYWPRPGELNKNNKNGFLINCGKLVTFLQSKLNLEVIKEEVIRLDDDGLLLKNKKNLYNIIILSLLSIFFNLSAINSFNRPIYKYNKIEKDWEKVKKLGLW